MTNTMIDLGSFRGRLIFWFGGLTLAILISVGFYVGRIATGELALAQGLALHTSARSAADLLAANLREREQEIDLLSQAPHFIQGDLASNAVRDSLERRKKAHDEYAWLGVTDINGKIVQATGGLLINQQVDQRPWFKAALAGPYTGDVHEAVLLAKFLSGSTEGEPLRFVDFSAPIHDEKGQLRGVLGSHVLWSWVTQTVNAALPEQAGQRGIEILIADRSGNILYPYELAGQFMLPARIETDAKHEMRQWEDGRRYLTSQAEVGSGMPNALGWKIVVRQPEATALAPVRALRNQLLGLGLAAAAFFALVAYRLAGKISQPIEQLAEAVRHIEKRDRDPVYPDGRQMREISQLKRSIQSMTETLLRHEQELEAVNASLEKQVEERTHALTLANQELERLATQDGLTGVNNRRRFDEKLQELFLLFKRRESSFTLLVVDVDHFKHINDAHGHPAGDAVLKQLARLLSESIRSTDFVARYGGEEFVVLLPGTKDVQEGVLVAEKIRRIVSAGHFPAIGHVTVSLGLSCSSPSDLSGADIMQRADSALYQAKTQGRDCVVARLANTPES